ncbi:Stk1 family PASTA domain-containing Ser/Thr kinase [Veillonella sp. CHU110]|uniref:Stk1 family PASTA domain-containing Ser/Thr kinase n=1 Tax=Veillonella sp. CHU110 TaxID=2490947 RepID=UPI000F8DF9D2|nr:Stk1 family PASTA domain-containing Ser/Thr kinase [Veillonella sp. CHU110]
MDRHTLVGLVFDHRYEVRQKIGVGGMADVYQGKDTLLGRPVAIKILHQNFGSDQDFVARFKREAQAAGKLNHPNVVSMYDVGYDQGYHYIIMEYVAGCTLKEYIQHHARVSVQEAVKITIAIAEGLEHAHAMGIVHCDVKPHNILITDTGRIKVTDFGIARAINSAATMMYTNSVMGSAHYISPEQASGKSINVSTDIYSLGVVLYELLTGEVPFRGETPVSVALQHVKDRVVAPRIKNNLIPPQLEQVVLVALEKEPGKRFGSISEMIQALRMSLGYRGGTSARPMQHDFATQVLPPMDTEVLEEEEESQDGIFAKLGSLPRKYIFGGALFAFILAFLWAFLSFGNFWSNSTVDVPNVVGKQLSVATRLLEERHLRVSSSEVTNSDVPAGQVISQSPEPGESVKEQRLVHLVVSKGAGDITIPDLQGMSFDQAREKLKSLGLSIGKVTYVSDTSKDDGVVISQGLQAGGKASKGATVDITVNQTKSSTIEIPNVVGMTIKEAKEALGNLGLSISKISGSNEDTAIVTDVSPAPGSSVKRDESVSLVGEAKADKKDSQSSKNSGPTKGEIDVTVPNGKTSQHIKVVIIDDEGSRVVYDGTNAPGDRIVKRVSGSGNVRVQTFLNGALVQEQSL